MKDSHTDMWQGRGSTIESEIHFQDAKTLRSGETGIIHGNQDSREFDRLQNHKKKRIGLQRPIRITDRTTVKKASKGGLFPPEKLLSDFFLRVGRGRQNSMSNLDVK